MPRKRTREPTTYFWLTPAQYRAIKLIGRYPAKGVDPKIIPARTRNTLTGDRKKLARYQWVKIRGTRQLRLFLTAKGKLARGL